MPEVPATWREGKSLALTVLFGDQPLRLGSITVP
jgi:hypothetical protein